MKRISALGLDVGKKRIGVAGCDGLGLLATELDTIVRISWQKDIDCLRYWVKERNAEILVVGLPYCMDGSLGFQAKQVQKFAVKVSKVLALPVDYVDERLTSVEAENQLKSDRRFSPQYNKGLIDRRAATIILQQWLDQQRE
ncbi:MAG: Holliday junction resolvase RuvX [Microcystaceae cyanobacterium]